MPALTVRVHGRVQGVAYRAFAQQQAEVLGASGWVRNEPDGSVLAFLQHCDAAVLDGLVDRLRAGPPAARVERMATAPAGEYAAVTGFSIRR